MIQYHADAPRLTTPCFTIETHTQLIQHLTEHMIGSKRSLQHKSSQLLDNEVCTLMVLASTSPLLVIPSKKPITFIEETTIYLRTASISGTHDSAPWRCRNVEVFNRHKGTRLPSQPDFNLDFLTGVEECVQL